MKKLIVLASGALALLMFACIAAPPEPTASSESALGCGPNQQHFNGVCRQVCKTNADCGAGDSCMNVGGNAPVCLAYQHCTHLDSDTSCNAGGAGYGYSTYGYDGPRCTGNAQWKVTAAKGDPACGEAHTVARCVPTAKGCGLVTTTTNDVAEP